MAVDERVLVRVRERDGGAWSEVLEEHERVAERIVRRFTRDRQLRLDLSEASRAAIVSSLLKGPEQPGFIRKAGALEGLTIRIAKAQCADWHRKKWRRSEREEAIKRRAVSAAEDRAGVDARPSLDRREGARLVGWLNELRSPKQREAVWLHCAESLPTAEIGMRQGRSDLAVRLSIHRGKRTIRERHAAEGRRMLQE